MPRAKEPFKPAKEIGARLRELRLRAGLTQAQVAILMGRECKGSHHMIGDIEKGRVPNLGIGTVADYLRACQASFDDLKDILDRYTSLPTAPEQAGAVAVGQLAANLPIKTATEVLKYDVKQAAARRARGGWPEPADKRQLRARKLARAALLREELHLYVKNIIDAEHLDRNWQDAKLLFDHARKVLGVLNRTRGKPPEVRQRMLDKARAWLVEQNLVPAASIDRVQESVVDWFGRQEKTGELDRLPPV